MKTKKLLLFEGGIVLHKRKSLLTLFSFVICQLMCAQQTYLPISLNGYNTDVVVDKDEDPLSSGYLDKPSNGYAYYSVNRRADGGLQQQFTSNGGVNYSLAPFTSNNVLKMSPEGSLSGTLTPATPFQTSELWILGTATESNVTVEVTVNYQDGSNTKASLEFRDWYSSDGNGTAVYGLRRIRAIAGDQDDRTNFSLYERLIITQKSKKITSIDFTIPSGKYLSIFAMSMYNEDIPKPPKTLYLIPNSHLDTQWNWTVETTIDQYVANTLNGNFNLFENNPEYKFNFEGAIKYKFAKEYYPEQYAKLKDYVASGQWHISGGSVDANDVIVPSAESIIRNFLYGQEFYKKEFGVKGGADMMLPDCFGFPYSLPTLANHCGVTGFHTAKLGWGSAYPLSGLPNFGLWQGVDGSKIYAVYKPGAYDNTDFFKNDLSYNASILQEINQNKDETGVASTFRYIGNMGDRGGSMGQESIDWLNTSINSDGPVTVKVGSPDDFFNSITTTERTGLPVWNNELPMEVHGVGCYTSQAVLKYWNRKNELLADVAEKNSVAADWLGGLPYQHDPIRNSWINIIWHQFHDDLTGTSIPNAYRFTYNDMALAQLNLAKTRNNAVGAVARQMNTNVTGIPIVVSNPLSIEREDIVEASIDIATEPVNISVYNPEGNPVLTQKTGYKDGKLSFIFLATVPSLGYATYDVRIDDNASASLTSGLSISTNTIENDEYKVTVDTNGDVSSIIDKKQSNIELLKSPIRMSMSLDQPGYWLAWEISRGDIERDPYGYAGKNAEISIVENGPLRATLKVTRTAEMSRDTDIPSTYRPSQYVQYIRLTSYGTKDRIDFVNEIDWQTTETFLKAEFDLNAKNEMATYDISIGTIDRKTREKGGSLFEVPGHQWADVTHEDNSYGISILNDCKYGWDKATDNKLRLTLIHTPKDGGNYSHQKNQDLGLNKFTYSFYRHMGKWNESTQWEAAKLNQPMDAYQATKHDGTLGKSYEFVNLNTDKVAIKALKKAESSDNIIVRVYELVGESHNNVKINFPANVVSAKEVNGIEEEIGTVSYSGNSITFDITKYQPRTFAVKLADPSSSLTTPTSQKVSLAYDIDVISNDSKKEDGQFGNANYLYPGELLTDEIVADGVAFAIGSRADGANNALKCASQEITLPQGSSNRKLYILAASKNPHGSNVAFNVDNKLTAVKVNYYADYVGQWGTVYSFQDYVKDNVAFTATHRHKIDDKKNEAYHYLYIYKYAIDIDANAQKLILPDNDDVIIFAISLSDNANDDVNPISGAYNLPKYDTLESLESNPKGELLIPAAFSASGSTNVKEGPEYAFDNNPLTKWCDNNSPTQWIEYSFDEQVEVSQWNVLHALTEGEEKISSEFRLQRYDENATAWVDVDVVTGNLASELGNFAANKTVRKVTPFAASRVRMQVDKGEKEHKVSRIYEFKLFGKSVLAEDDATLSSLSVANATLTPEFDPQTSEYTVTVGETLTSVTIAATASNPKATVEGAGLKENLITGENRFDITVTAKDGVTQKVYTVKVIRSASADATLNNLSVSTGTLDPTFKPDVTDYIVNVPNDVVSITLTADAKHQDAVVVGAGLKENLAVGNNKFEIVVTAPDGTTKLTYNVNVIRKVLNIDVSIHRLIVNGAEWDIDDLVDLGCDDYLKVQIETDPSSTVSIGNVYTETINKATLKDLTFRITAESGDYEDYVLKIERRYAFDDIVSVLWNNTLMLNLKKLREDGFEATGYQWYKANSAIKDAISATYSAGPSKVDLLDRNAEYFVEIKTPKGNIHTCAKKPNLKSMDIKAYPNPSAQGEVIYIDADIDDTLLVGAAIEIYNINGIKVASVKVNDRITPLNLPLSSGTYIVKFVSKNGFNKNLKTIVK